MIRNKFIKTIAFAGILLGFSYQHAHAALPKDNFPDKLDGLMTKGVYVRKGTIGASLCNVMELDRLLQENRDPSQIEKVIQDQRPLGRGLFVLDVFKLQPVKVWLSDPKRQGRILVAVFALKDNPELLTEEVRGRLNDIFSNLHPRVQQEISGFLK